MNHNTSKITFPMRLFKERGTFISYCPYLDVASQGLSEDQAIKNLIEAIELFVVTCFNNGNLAQVLRDCAVNLNTSPSEEQNFVEIEFSPDIATIFTSI